MAAYGDALSFTFFSSFTFSLFLQGPSHTSVSATNGVAVRGLHCIMIVISVDIDKDSTVVSLSFQLAITRTSRQDDILFYIHIIKHN